MNAVFAYGEEQGIFEEHGIDIVTTMGQGSAALLPSLDSGKLDLAVASTITPLVTQSQGMTLPIVSTFTANEGVPGSTAVLLVGKDSDIEDICGLKGRTVAVVSADVHQGQVHVATGLFTYIMPRTAPG